MSNDPRVARARERSMAAHPAGKGLPPEGYPSNSVLRELIAMAPVRDERSPEDDIEDTDDIEDMLARLGFHVLVPVDSFEENASEVFAELLGLLVSKQADYGPHAINRAPGGALNGINVRMHDKLSRAINLAAKYEEGGHGMLPGTPNHESMLDTYRDVANYAVIAVMVLEGTWPE